MIEPLDSARTAASADSRVAPDAPHLTDAYTGLPIGRSHPDDGDANAGRPTDALERMAAGMAHQMNNILAILRGALEQGQNDTPGSTEAIARRTMMLESIDRAASLTAQLLAFSRHQHIAPLDTRVEDLCTGIRPLLERLAAPDASLALAMDDCDGDAIIRVDRVQFQHMMAHLVTNARESMGVGGTVTIRCGSLRTPDPLRTTHSGTLPPGEYVTMSVSDTGCGMGPDVLDRLFEPFFTTKPPNEGNGLGLPSVLGVLKQHRAGISVESIPGDGSRFTIYWPVTGRGGSAAQGRTRTMPPRVHRQRRPTVLVVEDEPLLLTLTMRALQMCGCEVLGASGAREALAVLHRTPSLVDALVTDVRMPEMSGTELVSALLREGLEVPVLLVSGQLDTPIPVDWPDTLPWRFLAKPVRIEQLKQELIDLGVLADDAHPAEPPLS